MPQAFPWSRFCKASRGGGQLGKRSPKGRATGDPLPLSGSQGRRRSPAGPGAARSSRCAHLRRVVRPDPREAPVARLVVLPQPGLARDQAAQAEGREAAEQLQEPTLAAHVDPGSHGQFAARVRPHQRLVVQGVAHRVARPLPLLAQGPHTAGQLGDQPRPHLPARHGRGSCHGPAGRYHRRRAADPPGAGSGGCPLQRSPGAAGSGEGAGRAMARAGPGRAGGARRGRELRRPPTWEISDSDAEGPASAETPATTRDLAGELRPAAEALRWLRPGQAVRRLAVLVDPGAGSRPGGSPALGDPVGRTPPCALGAGRGSVLAARCPGGGCPVAARGREQ